MKIVLIVYNEAVDMEVMETLGNCALKNYTKVLGVFGKGETSGTHLGNDIWPGRNNMLFVACEEKEAGQSCIRQLRKKLGREGVKAFILPLEEVT